MVGWYTFSSLIYKVWKTILAQTSQLSTFFNVKDNKVSLVNIIWATFVMGDLIGDKKNGKCEL